MTLLIPLSPPRHRNPHGYRPSRPTPGTLPDTDRAVCLALVSPPGYGHPAEPARTARDRSGLWLRNAAAGLGVLAAAAAAVSFTAQYRMVYAARQLPVIARLEAAIPDAAALVFACLGIALALHGKPRAPRPGAERGLGRRQRVHERDRGGAGLAEPGRSGRCRRWPTRWPATP